jgi:hypothetical protein
MADLELLTVNVSRHFTPELPATGKLSRNGFLEMACLRGYVRQTAVSCCQLLPEWGIIRVLKEPLKALQGHWENQYVAISSVI